MSEEYYDLDEKKIIQEHYDKILNSAMFDGFQPST